MVAVYEAIRTLAWWCRKAAKHLTHSKIKDSVVETSVQRNKSKYGSSDLQHSKSVGDEVVVKSKRSHLCGLGLLNCPRGVGEGEGKDGGGFGDDVKLRTPIRLVEASSNPKPNEPGRS